MPIQKQNRFRNKWLFNLDRKQSLKRQEKRGYSCPSPFPTVIFSVISARYHQSQEDQHPWPRRQQHPKHLHWRLHSQGDGGLHLPRLHHLQQPLPGHRTEQTDRQRAAAALARLGRRVWDNTMLTISTKMKVYQACVLSTLLYGSETWTLYSHQECRLNTFHLRCFRRTLGITWLDRVPNKDVLAQAGEPSIFALLSQRRLRWRGHVSRTENGRIPKNMLYGELATGATPVGRPTLRFKDVCKRDLKAGNINPAGREAAAADRCRWRLAVKAHIETCEKRREEQRDERRERRQQRAATTPIEPRAELICSNRNRVY